MQHLRFHNIIVLSLLLFLMNPVNAKLKSTLEVNTYNFLTPQVKANLAILENTGLKFGILLSPFDISKFGSKFYEKIDGREFLDPGYLFGAILGVKQGLPSGKLIFDVSYIFNHDINTPDYDSAFNEDYYSRYFQASIEVNYFSLPLILGVNWFQKPFLTKNRPFELIEREYLDINITTLQRYDFFLGSKILDFEFKLYFSFTKGYKGFYGSNGFSDGFYATGYLGDEISFTRLNSAVQLGYLIAKTESLKFYVYKNFIIRDNIGYFWEYLYESRVNYLLFGHITLSLRWAF